jgi:hypothetical protein
MPCASPWGDAREVLMSNAGHRGSQRHTAVDTDLRTGTIRF